MKEISDNTWRNLWVKYKPRFKYFTTENWNIYCYTKKSWYRELHPFYDKYKLYNVLTVWGKKMLWHRVILMNYIEQPEDKPHCNHINWNKLDNRLENLERCDRSHNISEAQRLWLKPTKKLYQFSLDWKLIKVWNSIREASRECWMWIGNALRYKKNWVRYTTQNWYRWNTENKFPPSRIVKGQKCYNYVKNRFILE